MKLDLYKIVRFVLVVLVSLVVVIIFGLSIHEHNFYSLDDALDSLRKGEVKMGSMDCPVQPRSVTRIYLNNSEVEYRTFLCRDSSGTLILYFGNDFPNTKNGDFKLFGACFFPAEGRKYDYKERWFFCDTNRMANYIACSMKVNGTIQTNQSARDAEESNTGTPSRQ
ncbi:MAG TPA: hypothetical protein VH413_13665 [Verrucomicrobiae bacterium]|jgi:hypothetical protein|nr:hypothetical protein [Verrucomicrobiae bacterium]